MEVTEKQRSVVKCRERAKVSIQKEAMRTYFEGKQQKADLV